MDGEEKEKMKQIFYITLSLLMCLVQLTSFIFFTVSQVHTQDKQSPVKLFIRTVPQENTLRIHLRRNEFSQSKEAMVKISAEYIQTKGSMYRQIIMGKEAVFDSLFLFSFFNKLMLKIRICLYIQVNKGKKRKRHLPPW